MSKTLTLIFAFTAIAVLAAIGIPAYSAMTTLGGDTVSAAAPMVLAEDDSRSDDGSGMSGRSTEDEDSGQCEDDGGACGSTVAPAGSPAAAGTVAPPKNGLFGSGAAPQVQVK